MIFLKSIFIVLFVIKEHSTYAHLSIALSLSNYYWPREYLPAEACVQCPKMVAAEKSGGSSPLLVVVSSFTPPHLILHPGETEARKEKWFAQGESRFMTTLESLNLSQDV